MDWKTLVLSLLAVSGVISVSLEWLKIQFKKAKIELETWLQIVIPAVLSIALSWVVWSAFKLPGEKQILILYSLAVFLTQYYLSMEIMKRLGKPIAKYFMRLNGMTPEEIKEALG